MQLHQLQQETKNTTSRQVGRGGRRGKTSGRGHKGQKARAGHKIRPEIRDAIKKIPKLRGYRFNSRKVKPTVVNVGTLADTFSAGDTVTPKSLFEAGVISRENGRVPAVKILGAGELDTKLTIAHCQCSDTAKEKIQQAGGSVEEAS